MRFAETFLYHIWDAQHVQSNLKTVSQKKVTVKFHGRWNTSNGPDFKNAIVEIDGEVKQGDIEIHYESYDWIAHHHHENSHFNNVILHVVFKHQQRKPYTIKENGEKIDILELASVLDDDISKLLTVYEHKGFSETEHLCNFFSGLDKTQTIQCLTYFGQERFSKKVKRFTAELEFASFNQLLYQGIMEAAGYSKNKFQMLQLAQQIPYDVLHNWFQQRIKKEEMLAIFLGSSGLLQKLPSTFPNDIIKKWKEIYAAQKYYQVPLQIDWDFFRIRPQNHPAIRLFQIINVLFTSFSVSLQQKLVSLFSYPKDTFSITDFQKRFYAFFQQESTEIPETYLLGERRLDVILVNIILPVMTLYARKNQYFDLELVIKLIYSNYNGLASNTIITHMETGMEEYQKRLVRRSALLQQGVLELYNAYCEYRMCDLCHILRNKLIVQM